MKLRSERHEIYKDNSDVNYLTASAPIERHGQTTQLFVINTHERGTSISKLLIMIDEQVTEFCLKG